jgi:hypothetical protein
LGIGKFLAYTPAYHKKRWIEQSLGRQRTDSSGDELDVKSGGEAAYF